MTPRRSPRKVYAYESPEIGSTARATARTTPPMDSTNDEATTADPPEIATRFNARDAENGSVEIYDEENDQAWIRSDYALELGRPS